MRTVRRPAHRGRSEGTEVRGRWGAKPPPVGEGDGAQGGLGAQEAVSRAPRQQQVATDYADLISKQLLTPANMMEELFRGQMSDRIMDLVHKTVKRMVDEQAGIAKPLVVYALGGDRYIEMKEVIAEKILSKLPETMKHMEAYAADAMDIRNTLVERMRKLTPEEFEGMLRPAFQEDEKTLIIVGGVLGVVVGEMQVPACSTELC